MEVTILRKPRTPIRKSFLDTFTKGEQDLIDSDPERPTKNSLTPIPNLRKSTNTPTFKFSQLPRFEKSIDEKFKCKRLLRYVCIPN